MAKESDCITVFAPATVANVGCGFDVLGFALEKPGDEVTVKKIAGTEIIINKMIGAEVTAAGVFADIIRVANRD